MLTGPCPFCAGEFSAGYDREGTPAVTHTAPVCTRFDELEPIAYLEAVRLARQS